MSSSIPVATVADQSPESKKRKREFNKEDLEIDLDAPEPPSKKALRKAKKTEVVKAVSSEKPSEKPIDGVRGTESVLPNPQKRSEHGIWIGNLAFFTTKEDLLDFVTGDTEHTIPKENVSRINLPAGPVKHGKFQNKGFAYVDFVDAKTLRSALQLSEKLFGGRRVLIKDANNFEGRPKETTKDTSTNPPSKRIFVGNLDFDTTAEDIEQHFGVCGPIQHTQVATFEDSGKCKGYAWVEFEELSSGQAAMRGWVEEGSSINLKKSKNRVWLNKLKGRKLRMEFAEDKTTRYNKRFGKNTAKEHENSTEPAIQEVDGPGQDGRASVEIARGGQDTEEQHKGTHSGRGRPQRYTEETVKKLTGAIVESKGQRVTFD